MLLGRGLAGLLEKQVQQRKQGSSKDDAVEQEMGYQDSLGECFKTPVADSLSLPLQPKKLFRSTDHTVAKKRRKGMYTYLRNMPFSIFHYRCERPRGGLKSRLY